MNIFHKAALADLRRNRTQTVVTVIGVLLSAAMITAVAAFGVSLLDYVTRGAIRKYGDWHVALTDASPEEAQALAGDSRISAAVSIDNVGYALLEDGKNPDKPYLFLAGLPRDAGGTLPVVLLSGRMPENAGEVVVPAHLAVNGGVSYALGDTLTLSVGVRQGADGTLGQGDPLQEGETLAGLTQRSYTVVGICQRPAFEPRTAPGYTLITTAGSAPASQSVYLRLRQPRQARAFAAGLDAGSDALLNDDVLRFMGASDDTLFNTLLYAVAGIVVAIVMVGSFFMIHNAFAISLNERMRQIGMLSSVGATARQLRGMVLFEGLCIGLIGIPPGLLVGLVSMGALLRAVSNNFGSIMYSGVELTLVVSPAALLAAVAVSLATILFSAYVPAKKAAATPVMECIRQTNEIKVEAKAVRIAPWQSRLLGLEGVLALKNFKRNKKRYRSVVLSLTLSVVLFLTTSAFVTYLQQASEMAIVFTTYDICLSAPSIPDYALQNLYGQLRQLDGVTDGNLQQLCYYRAEVPADALTDTYWEAAGGEPGGETVPLFVSIQFFDDETYRAMVESQGLPAEEYAGPDAKLLGVAIMPIDDGREHEAEDFPALFRDDETSLALRAVTGDGTAEAEHPVTVTWRKFTLPDTVVSSDATDYEDTLYYLQVAAPWSLKETLAADAKLQAKGMTFCSETPAETTAAMDQLLEASSLGAPYVLYNMHDMLAESRNYIFIANVFGYVFIVMISLIAVANVFNTISTNIRLRRQELAMLRSVGMADRAFDRMMRCECLFYGVRALAAGLPMGLLCNLLVCRGMYAAGFDGIRFAFPWAELGISTGSVLLVVFATMMYAVGKLRRENILDALRDDMA